jgi:hypothetical protein
MFGVGDQVADSPGPRNPETEAQTLPENRCVEGKVKDAIADGTFFPRRVWKERTT